MCKFLGSFPAEPQHTDDDRLVARRNVQTEPMPFSYFPPQRVGVTSDCGSSETADSARLALCCDHPMIASWTGGFQSPRNLAVVRNDSSDVGGNF